MSKELVCVRKAWELAIRKSQEAGRNRTMSGTHIKVEDDDERCPMTVLSNGDLYGGRLLDNLPHGQGKYLWTDGCMYVGEWNKGKITGKGKFSWPSGATYEGDFKSGFMDGNGTYTGGGGTYKGNWVMNLKHGKGTKNYANGDYYDGEWRNGVQEGQGRYHWGNNGNHYIGQWKGGTMNGDEGTMMWSNGNRFDGSWEDGFPRGNGTFKFADGSLYLGVWNRDPREQSGTFYPSTASDSANQNWDPGSIFTRDLNGCAVCPSEKVSIFPFQKTVSWPGVDGTKEARPRRCSIDGRHGSNGNLYGLNGDGDGGEFCSLEESDLSRRTPLHPIKLKAAKRQGQTISKGHKNYDLMLNLQLGIRHSVGRPAPSTSLDLKSSAFDPKEKVWTKFPPEGSKHTPPHQSCDFRWKDYCPLVFRTLRKLFKVDAADYMLSICGNDALRELSSPGKSGSFFITSMFKTYKSSFFLGLIPFTGSYKDASRLL